jgi:hypothetical protein
MRKVLIMAGILAAVHSTPVLAQEEAESPGSRISFHGYGELHYNNPMVDGIGHPSGDLPPTLDFHRLVFGWSYLFSERVSLHVEIDYEHAANELELEFAYVDFQWTDAINFRAGSVLMPVGPLNEFHEPTLFYSVERPYVQKYIIPTTWGAGGAGLFGQPIPGLKYRVYFVEGLDASGFDETGIKDGRQVLFEDTNKAFNWGGVGRVEYVGLTGLTLGASLYSAGAAQGDPTISSAHVTLWDLDARYRFMGFDLTGLYARTRIGGADRISAQTGTTVGSRQTGWYIEGAYHLSQLTDTSWDLVPFVRWEEFDTQDKVPAGLSKDPANDQRVITYGLAFYPIPDVALKIDREEWRDDSGLTDGRTNLALAFMF